jgi:hypothetical protein
MKNTIKGNFVGFTNGDPTITNSKDTIKGMTNNKQQTMKIQIEKTESEKLTMQTSNCVISFQNAKLIFDKPQVELIEVIEVYSELKTFLNSFNNVYL